MSQGSFRLSAANEMNDLDAVALREFDAGPFVAADHLEVEFDGEPFGREREMFDEREQSRPFVKVFRLAVEFDLQARL